MGSLYRPKSRPAGGTKKDSAIIWLKYFDARGVPHHFGTSRH